MILSLLALAAAQAAQPPSQTTAEAQSHSDEALYRDCVSVVRSDAERGLALANDWRMRGGGVLARQCLGLAYTALERWAPAAVAFEQAAREAETAQDPRRADFWVQSGNSWLAGGEPAKAVAAFDAALATTALTPELRGETHIDRARAGVALGNLAAARADLDRALELVPADPFGWLLSAALALREQDIPRARKDIAKAIELAPDDPDILLQAGTVAGTAGDMDTARAYYERVVALAPESAAGEAARTALGSGEAKEPSAASSTP